MASSLVLSRKEEEISSTNLQSALVQAFLPFKASPGRPAIKNATFDVISSQPIASFLPTHEAGHVIHRPGHEVNHVLHRPGHEADRHFFSANHVAPPWSRDTPTNIRF